MNLAFPDCLGLVVSIGICDAGQYNPDRGVKVAPPGEVRFTRIARWLLVSLLALPALPATLTAEQTEMVLRVPEGADPILSIGQVEADDPAYELYRIQGARRLSDGSIVAMVAGQLEVRKFDASGIHLWSAGRAGQGPGEFTLPSLLPTCTSDDVVVIHDRIARRVTLLDAGSGGFLDDYRLDTGTKTPYSAIQCAPSGRMVFTTFGGSGRERAEGPYRWHHDLYFIDGEDAPLTVLRAEFPGAERVIYYRDGRPNSEGPRTWGREPVFAATDEGIWFGTADDYAIELIDWTGATRNRIRWEGRDRVVTEENMEAYQSAIRRQYEDRGTDNWEAMYEERIAYDRKYLPDAFPAYGDIRRIGDRIWVREFLRPGESEQRWRGFAADGREIGLMVLPAHLNVQHFDPGGEWLLAITTDRLGVERLVVYELVQR